jgi:cytochrome c-type biogenesis protein CcmF
MGDLGFMALLIGLVLAIYGAIGSILGKFLGNQGLIDSARFASYLTTLALMISAFSLVGSFLNRDFELKYVFEHSSLSMPRLYTWVAIYAGNEGSLLFIATLLSILSTTAIFLSPYTLKPSLPYTIATLMFILIFFLLVMTFLANPFAKLTEIPVDGLGINPLLRHPGMFFHPPMLMAGLIMVSVPFSFAIGALLSNNVNDDWVDAGRTWGILAWAVLGIGLLLGGWWAYTILGWGGYWAWDPVENAGLMPFLGLTAFIHSIMVQKRLGMFRMWNLVLIFISFGLALFGMFINRGGPVPSVHSFAASTLGWVFLSFLVVGTVIPFLIFSVRFNKLKSAKPLQSILSRESSFLMNNLLLLSIAFVTLWGAIYPILSELISGFTITVGQPFYNQVNGPLFLCLIFLMGIGPFLPWRQASLKRLRDNLLLPISAGCGGVVLLVISGIQNPLALLSFGLIIMVTTGILKEFIAGTRVIAARGGSHIRSLILLVSSNRPRYGGYIVHIAVMALALGITGTSFFSTQKDVLLAPGETVDVGKYTITYLSSSKKEFLDRSEAFFSLEAQTNSGSKIMLQTERTFYKNFGMSATRAGISSTPFEDLYIVPSETRVGTDRIGFRILINPLVWWIWVAGPIMIVGTVVALWPSTHSLRRFTLTKKLINKSRVNR